MVALFRIEELVGGQIYIDGIDISRIPVQLLRKKLCIIPQDPVMFSATVRFNLDPFNECTDSQLWEVLEDVQMKTHIESLPSQLLELVSEGGDNFSSGQRQVCVYICIYVYICI
jgi:ABC-type multidrug transport system fused ATPase/permease subunit